MDARDRMHRKADSDHAESASSSTTVAFFRAKFKPAKSDDDGGAGVARHLKQAESIYTDVMISVLEGIQSNGTERVCHPAMSSLRSEPAIAEEARIRCFRAALRKIVVFETSLVANRSCALRPLRVAHRWPDASNAVDRRHEGHGGVDGGRRPHRGPAAVHRVRQIAAPPAPSEPVADRPGPRRRPGPALRPGDRPDRPSVVERRPRRPPAMEGTVRDASGAGRAVRSDVGPACRRRPGTRRRTKPNRSG